MDRLGFGQPEHVAESGLYATAGHGSRGEGVTADEAGNVHVGMNATKAVEKYVKKSRIARAVNA
jgi:hypothetical protein